MATKSWQDDVRESAHKIWLAGLGALAVAEQEGSKLFGELVKQGEQYEAQAKERARHAADKAQSAAGEVADQTKKVAEAARRAASEFWGKTSDNVEEAVARAMGKVGVPTRDEIAALSRRVEELTLAVERLREKTTPTGESPLPAITTKDDVTTTANVATGPKP
jgi:poly(hydroxyalkanoate) granule-associated protein